MGDLSIGPLAVLPLRQLTLSWKNTPAVTTTAGVFACSPSFSRHLSQPSTHLSSHLFRPGTQSGALFGHAFDNAGEDERNFVTRGAQTIESGHDARGDLALTSLAHDVRDVFLFAVVAVMDKGMNGLIGNATIDTIQMRARETLSGKFLLGAALAFDLGIGNDVVVAKKGPQVSGDEIGLQGRQLGVVLSSQLVLDRKRVGRVWHFGESR